ncbi:MAG: hypothetical protein M3447_03890 [Acidobacteriota bacterium]|nr:hypothetical protein [Acidobacteriota bacterium]
MTTALENLPGIGKSIRRGLDFIYRIATTAEGFDSYGSMLICCFALVGANSRDPNLRQLTRLRARKLNHRWRRLHPVVPPTATPNLLLDFVMVSYALSRISVRDVALNAEIRAAAKQFSIQELLGFNPASEPPANDLPYPCDCGLRNQRGRTFCKNCKKRLEIQSSYRVWMEALANSYVGGRCGLLSKTYYPDVLRWLPSMRPYPVGKADVELVRDAIYAVTHVVYSLNDYGTYQLSRRWLPREFAFLKANVGTACERKDPEVLGELLDSLKAFGLEASHPLIRRGTRYLLTSQNKDGSWGDPDEADVGTRCHTTWTAIDGLRTFAWRGERLSSRAVKSMLSGVCKGEEN